MSEAELKTFKLTEKKKDNMKEIDADILNINPLTFGSGQVILIAFNYNLVPATLRKVFIHGNEWLHKWLMCNLLRLHHF